MSNRYLDLLQTREQEKRRTNNPYLKLDGTNVIGSEPPVREGDERGTSFSRIQRTRREAEEARKVSEKKNSFGGLFGETLKGLPRATWNLAKQVAQDPVESARQAALGFSNGLTFGATDYLQRRAFVKEAEKHGMDEEVAKSVAERVLMPQDNELSAIRGGGNFAGMAAQYAMGEALLVKGMKYAAGGFVAKHAHLTRFMADLGVGISYGQIEESFREPEERQRLARLGIDAASSVLFFGTGAVYRRLRPTVFQKLSGVRPAANSNTIVPAGETVSADALTENANKMIGELRAIPNKTAEQTATLKQLEESLTDPDKLFELNKKGVVTSNVNDSNTAVTVRIGEEAVEAADDALGATAKGTELTVATNNLDSLQSYIKGSNTIEYKVIKEGLGVDSAGNKIAARHEFNPTTGKHTIYTTDNVSASTLAHELGHFFDKQLTESTQGLSRLLPRFDDNREAIEDALGSFSVARLGGNATGDAISADIRKVSSDLISEASTLSAIRQGGRAQVKASEQFADAVSEILTNPQAARQAPVLTGLLKHLDDINQTSLLGKNISENISGSGARFAVSGETPKNAGTVVVPKVQLEELSVPKNLESVSNVIEKFDKKLTRVVDRINSAEKAGTKETGNAIRALTRQEANVVGAVKEIEDTNVRAQAEAFLNDRLKTAQGALEDYRGAIKESLESVKEQGPRPIIEKKVGKELDRTPTDGRQPKAGIEDLDSAPVRTELLTSDSATKEFFDKNITPSVTGKFRIAKNNDEIIERSLSSKLTEDDFDEILTTRFGNLSEDVLKAKRLMNDKALDVVDMVSGRDLDSIPPTELANITREMNQIVEMFEVMSGVRTELSNSFRTLGIQVAPGENDVLRQVVGEIQRVLGKSVDGFDAAKNMVKLRESSVVDKYFTLWYPAILSGPKTTARNIVGTGSNLVTETVSQLFSKEGRKTFMTRLNAMVGAQKESWTRAKAIFKGDEDMLSKFIEAPAQKDKVFKGKWAFLNNVEYVGRFLDAQDAYFSNIAREGEIAALRAGSYNYGIKNETIRNTLDEGVAQAFAQRITYRNTFEDTGVGIVGRAITAMKAADNEFTKAAFTYVMPFVRTVANVTDRKLDYIPIINYARTFRGSIMRKRAEKIVRDVELKSLLRKDALDNGMAESQVREFVDTEVERITEIITQRVRQQQMGKFYMGLTVTAGLVPLAMDGRISGAGPKNRNERDTLMQTGWRPNSLILPGGVVLPYNNLGPLAGVFSMIGNISDSIRYGDVDEDGVNKMFWKGFESFMRGEMDQSFLSGVSDIYDTVYGFKDIDDLFADMAANAIPIPAAWTQAASIVNPKIVETNTFLESVQKKTGITAGLEPKLNVFGEEYAGDLIWGLTPTMLNTDDPVFGWMVENNVFIGKPQKGTKIRNRQGDERKMTPEEYTQYVEATGQAIYTKLERLVEQGRFDRFETEEDKKKAVDKIVNDIRQKEKRKFDF